MQQRGVAELQEGVWVRFPLWNKGPKSGTKGDRIGYVLQFPRIVGYFLFFSPDISNLG